MAVSATKPEGLESATDFAELARLGRWEEEDVTNAVERMLAVMRSPSMNTHARSESAARRNEGDGNGDDV